MPPLYAWEAFANIINATKAITAYETHRANQRRIREEDTTKASHACARGAKRSRTAALVAACLGRLRALSSPRFYCYSKASSPLPLSSKERGKRERACPTSIAR